MFSFNYKKYKHNTDEELIALYKANGRSIFIGILYERYGHLVMGACMKYLKNPAEAEDMTMQIFENLHTKLLKHEVNFFKSWLYMVTKNECFMFLRKKGNSVSFNEVTESASEDYSEELKLKEQKLSILEEVIPLLKDDQRICIELFYLKELSYQQISDQLKLSLMQVKSAIQNGKRNLKLRLEERNEFN